MQFGKWSAVILAIFTVLSIIPCLEADCPQPQPTMMLYGYVFIRTIAGQNETAPQGLRVYATTDDKALSNVTTDTEGRYTLPITGLENGTSVNISVQNIKVTGIQYYDWNVTWLNLTVTDLTPPSIELLSPQLRITLQQLPIWINATITDDLMINASSITTNLNETTLVSNYDSANGLLSCSVLEANSGIYVVNLTVEDLAGNAAAKTWNFTYSTPPTISLIFPTIENPAYTRSGENVTIVYNYAEPYPRNVTMTVHNATNTIGRVFILALEEGNKTRNDTLLIDKTNSDAKYALSVTIFNIFDLSQQIQQAEAVVIDDTPPTIKQIDQSPSADNVQPTDTVKVNATIEDALSGVRSARLLWRTENGEWNSIPMDVIAPDIYRGTIPAVPNQTQVYYKIEASDKAGNQAAEDNAGQYYTYHFVPEYPMITLIFLLSILTSATSLLRKSRTVPKLVSENNKNRFHDV